MDHPPPGDKNHRLQSVVLFVLLALCGMVWYTLQHVTVRGLFPCGEGAGYAGGIVSAGVDGERCAEAAANYFNH